MRDLKNSMVGAAALALMGWFAAVSAQTTSPFTPPEEDLGVYVVNSGGGLDTGCTYRSGGPLEIRIPVPPIVSRTQLLPDGRLRNAAALIANNVVGGQAIIRFPVFDIDSTAVIAPPQQPEVDRVSFNGTFRKVLSGVNNQWTDDSMVVPIEEIRFGTDNILRIDIDTANTALLWCMAVDWVAIQFNVAAPYVLTHGINADRTTWEGGSAPGVLAALDERGVAYNYFTVGRNERSSDNARLLDTRIADYLREMKSKKVHIIAHSKGGLDTQELQARAPDFTILSLSTLSTPHGGSVAADLSIIQKTEADRKSNLGQDPQGFAAAYLDTWTFGQGPQLPGLRDLTVRRASEARRLRLRANIANTFTFSANADLNEDEELTANESAGLFPGVAHYAAERAWQVLRNFASAPIVETTEESCFFCLGGTRTVLRYRTVPSTPQENDIVVTLDSAHPSYGRPLGIDMANHSTIKNVDNIGTILDRTIPLR